MKRRYFQWLLVAGQVLLDMASLVIALEAAYRTRFVWQPFVKWLPAILAAPPLSLYHSAFVALLPMCFLVFCYAGFYQNLMLSAYDDFVRIAKGMLLVYIVTGAMTFASHGWAYSRLVAGFWALYGLAIIYLLRQAYKAVFRRLLYRFSGPHKVLAIGRGKVLEAIRQIVSGQPLIQTFFLDSVPDVKEMEDALKKNAISEVLFVQGTIPAQDILQASRVLERHDVECRVIPDLLELRRGEIILNGFFGLPSFHIKPLSLYGGDYVLKRVFDIGVSIAILGVLFIPLLVIAILIRCDSSGPILFSQVRLGLRGRHFKVYKFRTMVVGADALLEQMKHRSERKGPVFKMKNDPRVTRVGRWLRRFSLDEVPQLLNVIRGDMSLVGPRPQVIWEAEHNDDHAKKRLRIKPGLTGLWQVSGRAALSYEEMIDLDVYYLENWSLGLDLKILLRTLPAVFAKEGAS
jgi:exopolysaccharide biosynthesis polyprenyl glycosylphosphotransferase